MIISNVMNDISKPLFAVAVVELEIWNLVNASSVFAKANTEEAFERQRLFRNEFCQPTSNKSERAS